MDVEKVSLAGRIVYYATGDKSFCRILIQKYETDAASQSANQSKWRFLKKFAPKSLLETSYKSELEVIFLFEVFNN